MYGENVGSEQNGSSLDEPRSLNKRRDRVIRGTAVPGFDPRFWGKGAQMVGVRHYGRLFDGQVPARLGTTIRVKAILNDVRTRNCGSGSVVDDEGNYFVDVPAKEGCLAARAGDGRTLHQFTAGGRRAGAYSNGASLDLPRSLGRYATRTWAPSTSRRSVAPTSRLRPRDSDFVRGARA